MADDTITVKREQVESWLELFEGVWHPCTADCECVIHSMRELLGQDDSPEARSA